MSAQIFDVEWLGVENSEGYGLPPIPNRRDEQISSLIRQRASLSAAERGKSIDVINEDRSATLLAYSERMASLAVRRNSRELLLLGLLALCLDGWKGDWRENTLLLCLHFDAAMKIGVAPGDVFGGAANLLSAPVGASLEAFLVRAPEDQTLSAMGYEESADSDGFRYRRCW